jgi:hypothetical protein
MDEELQYDQSPGLDRHVYESEWASLEPQIVDSPIEALPEVTDLVERLLRDRGYPLDDPVALNGTDPEIVTEFREVKRVADDVAGGADVDPGDVGAALEDLRDLYQRAIGEATSP